MDEIYLDNSATTLPSPEVIAAMDTALHICGNPSSVHEAGLDAAKMVSSARRSILSALGVVSPARLDYPRLIFTGSGTEANNLALFGCAYTRRDARFRPKLIISGDQHPSVLEPAARLSGDGCDVVYLSTKGGKIDEGELLDAVDSSTILLSIMLVNNETGAVYDVKRLFAAAKRKNPNLVTHCDAVQGFLKLPDFTPDGFGCDFTSISAHKLRGPKGIGALYVSAEAYKSRKLSPYILGGGQENGMRSGTENTSGIAGFGEAVKHKFDSAHARFCRDYIVSRLPSEVTVKLPEKPAPHILNLTLPHIKSETMLHFLSAKGIYVSAGSACASHAKHTSKALLEFGSTPAEASNSIRISLYDDHQLTDLDAFLSALAEGVNSLVRT